MKSVKKTGAHGKAGKQGKKKIDDFSASLDLFSDRSRGESKTRILGEPRRGAGSDFNRYTSVARNNLSLISDDLIARAFFGRNDIHKFCG